MADGSKKPVEQIIAGDMVQVFNHETGKVEVSRVIFNDHSLQEAQIYKIINCELLKLFMSMVFLIKKKISMSILPMTIIKNILVKLL